MVYNGIQWFSMVSDGLGWSHMGLRWGGVGLGWTSECAEVIIIVMKIKIILEYDESDYDEEDSSWW